MEKTLATIGLVCATLWLFVPIAFAEGACSADFSKVANGDYAQGASFPALGAPFDTWTFGETAVHVQNGVIYSDNSPWTLSVTFNGKYFLNSINYDLVGGSGDYSRAFLYGDFGALEYHIAASGVINLSQDNVTNLTGQNPSGWWGIKSLTITSPDCPAPPAPPASGMAPIAFGSGALGSITTAASGLGAAVGNTVGHSSAPLVLISSGSLITGTIFYIGKKIAFLGRS